MKKDNNINKNLSMANNVCTRCGKERIVLKKWEEEIKTESHISRITHIKTSCPDKECQKIVDKTLAAQKLKDEERRSEKRSREIADKEEKTKRMEIALAAKPKNKKRKKK